MTNYPTSIIAYLEAIGHRVGDAGKLMHQDVQDFAEKVAAETDMAWTEVRNAVDNIIEFTEDAVLHLESVVSGFFDKTPAVVPELPVPKAPKAPKAPKVAVPELAAVVVPELAAPVVVAPELAAPAVVVPEAADQPASAV